MQNVVVAPDPKAEPTANRLLAGYERELTAAFSCRSGGLFHHPAADR